jgi:hypothetical protein
MKIKSLIDKGQYSVCIDQDHNYLLYKLYIRLNIKYCRLFYTCTIARYCNNECLQFNAVI